MRVNLYILGVGMALIITGLVMLYSLYRTRRRYLRSRRHPLNLR
jgi:hypothetical protein